ncbi:hypothetical protein B5V01_07970 [Mesorhizobium erdmanii]|uniref:Uncharacterized protein n=3 Tax=Phyllobacteriaceae TaxID=69277 RepID=A0A3M9X313_9HYPH|nr:hypothetical protein DNR46_28960 [Mesorhizobium japonicum]RXT47897.1 hypothetical protein B5V01_07970 [Mesorhizobium erdmanii]
MAHQAKEAIMRQRKIDLEKFDRADRESRLILDAERQARAEKTARLREQRLKAMRAALTELKPANQA